MRPQEAGPFRKRQRPPRGPWPPRAPAEAAGKPPLRKGVTQRPSSFNGSRSPHSPSTSLSPPCECCAFLQKRRFALSQRHCCLTGHSSGEVVCQAGCADHLLGTWAVLAKAQGERPVGFSFLSPPRENQKAALPPYRMLRRRDSQKPLLARWEG